MNEKLLGRKECMRKSFAGNTSVRKSLAKKRSTGTVARKRVGFNEGGLCGEGLGCVDYDL